MSLRLKKRKMGGAACHKVQQSRVTGHLGWEEGSIRSFPWMKRSKEGQAGSHKNQFSESKDGRRLDATEELTGKISHFVLDHSHVRSQPGVALIAPCISLASPLEVFTQRVEVTCLRFHSQQVVKLGGVTDETEGLQREMGSEKRDIFFPFSFLLWSVMSPSLIWWFTTRLS